MMEFGALICKPKLPECYRCCIKSICASSKFNKFKKNKKNIIIKKNYDIFCYLDKEKKKIALTKKNNLGFLEKLCLPDIEETIFNKKNKGWKFLRKYNNFISNKKLKINLYYKFTKKIPLNFEWYSLKKNKEFIPTFTKKIFKQVLILYK